jgi:hypothetical protein
MKIKAVMPTARQYKEIWPMLTWEFRQDKRKHPRFHVVPEAIVVLKSHPSTLGKIVDVSLDGLSFRYLHHPERLSHTTVLDVFRVGSGYCLERAAFKTVATEKMDAFTEKFHVQFSGLNRRQKAKLKKFIEDATLYAA